MSYGSGDSNGSSRRSFLRRTAGAGAAVTALAVGATGTALAGETTLTIEGLQDNTDYYFEISSNDLTHEDNDTNDSFGDDWASGTVHDGRTDTYTFSGVIDWIDLSGGADFLRDGGFESPSDDPDRHLRIFEDNGSPYYQIRSEGSIEVHHNSLENYPDDIGGNWAEGSVADGGEDHFLQHGESEEVYLNCDEGGRIYLDWDYSW